MTRSSMMLYESIRVVEDAVVEVAEAAPPQGHHLPALQNHHHLLHHLLLSQVAHLPLRVAPPPIRALHRAIPTVTRHLNLPLHRHPKVLLQAPAAVAIATARLRTTTMAL